MPPPVPDDRGFSFVLEESEAGLQLRARHHPSYGPIRADWTGAEVRRRIAAGRKQLLARAVGLDRHRGASILDATAGMGRDGFVLATLGAQLTMSERHPTVCALLQDARHRALLDPASADAASRIDVREGDARLHMAQGWDVVYLDPMYPGRNKTALASKELQLLRELTGGDADADSLLDQARRHARLRVAVKRPLKAPWLAGLEPRHSLSGSQARFDIYFPLS